MALPKSSQKGLWDSFVNGSIEDFWNINAGLVLGPSFSNAGTGIVNSNSDLNGDGGDVPRAIPIRLYPVNISSNETIIIDRPTIQDLLSPRDPYSGIFNYFRYVLSHN